MMSSEIIESYLMIFLVSLVVSSVAICTVVIIALEFNWNIKSLLDKLKPERSTPLQKEIEAERKEIEKLKRHKRDMEELEELKNREINCGKKFMKKNILHLKVSTLCHILKIYNETNFPLMTSEIRLWKIKVNALKK